MACIDRRTGTRSRPCSSSLQLTSAVISGAIRTLPRRLSRSPLVTDPEQADISAASPALERPPGRAESDAPVVELPSVTAVFGLESLRCRQPPETPDLIERESPAHSGRR